MSQINDNLTDEDEIDLLPSINPSFHSNDEAADINTAPTQKKHSQGFTTPCRKRKLDIINESIDKLNKLSNRGEPSDELDHFGKFIVGELRKMSEYDKILCQEEVHALNF